MRHLKEVEEKYHLKRVFKETKRYLICNITLFLTGFMATIFSYIYPIIEMYIIDKSIGKKNYKLLILYLVVYVGVMLLELIFNIIQTRVSVRITSFIEMDLKKRVVKYFMNLKFRHFVKYDSGKIDTIVKSDLMEFKTIISSSLQDILLSLVQIFIIGFAMIRINIKMGIIMIIFQALDMILFFKMNGEMEKVSVELRDSYINQNRVLNDIIRYIRSIRLIGAKEYLFHCLDHVMKTKVKKTEKMQEMSIKIGSVGTILLGIMLCVTYMIGGYEIIYGSMTLGMLVSFIQYSSKFSSPVSSFSNNIIAYSENIAQIREISGILDKMEQKEKMQNEKHILQQIDRIDINELNFRYSDQEPYIFHKANAVFDKNHVYFLVGKTGSGKSTLMRILMGQYEIGKNMVLFNDVDIQTLSCAEEYINWFPQDPIILYDTIYNNITLGKKISEKKLKKICIACQIYEDIMAMDKKFDTLLEENGSNISGGQKQRIALARTLLEDKPIIILDEVTSAIDRQTEQMLKENIENLTKGKIVIIITHSRDFIMEKAIVYEVNNGKIIKENKVA